MLRIIEDGRHRALFCNHPILQDDNKVRNTTHNTDVMRDQQTSESAGTLHVQQQRQYLSLNCHVQRRSWFIENQELWIYHQCARQRHSLQLTAR